MNSKYVKIKTTKKYVKAKINHPSVKFSHAPKFRIRIGSFNRLNKKAKSLITRKLMDRAEGVVDTHIRYVFIANAMTNVENSIRFHIQNRKNKTGVTGVSLEHQYRPGKSPVPYAYTSTYNIAGVRYRKRFSFSRYGSPLLAYSAACKERIAGIITTTKFT
jgi:hypothetical protein